MVKLAAKIITIIFIFLSIFQLSLIFGAPFGHFAWGGQHETLPTNLRIASISSILLYALFSIIILDRAKVISIFKNKKIGYIGTWILTIYFFSGILLNAVSKSEPERYTMTPIVVVLFLITLYVARSKK